MATVVAFAGTVHGWFEPEFWSRALEFITFAVLLVVVTGVGFGCWLFLQNVVCGYFFSKLTLKTEVLLGTDANDLHEQSFLADVRDAVRDTSALVGVQAGLLW